MKIAICGLVKSENLGEMFIARSLEYLIEQELHMLKPDTDIQFVEVDLLGRNDEISYVKDPFENKTTNYYGYDPKFLMTETVFAGLRKITLKIKNVYIANPIHWIRHIIYSIGKNYRRRLYQYFSDKMDGVDFIVVDGAGLLEYAYNEYQEPLLLISKYAEKHGLSVVYNAIGKAGPYDERDFRSRILRKALRSPAVKYVSARDSQPEVQQCVGDRLNVELLADAAFWMKEAYRETVTENENRKIGIGLIRGNSLTGYGTAFGRKKWVQLFSGIANKLSERGYEFEFFTNGLPGDTVLGNQILKKMDLPQEYLVERPLEDKELYNTISKYDGIITCRMHSAIAAFSLGIPSVILSWNDKVEKLMETVGYPERAVKVESFDPEHIVDLFEKAMDEGVDMNKVNRLKDMALKSVKDYIDLIAEKA